MNTLKQRMALAGLAILGTLSIRPPSVLAFETEKPAVTATETVSAPVVKLLAMGIASASKDTAIRQAIYAETQKQFDGDTEVLYSALRKISVGERGTFHDAVVNALIRITGDKSISESLERDLAANPKLHVAVRDEDGKWDPRAFGPIVAIDPEDEAGITYIEGYTPDLKPVQLSAKVAPTEPVIVIGQNERVDDKGNVTQNLSGVGMRSGAIKSLKKTVVSTGPEEKRVCMIGNGGNTSMIKIKVPNLSDIESWTKGKPELQLTVIGEKGGTLYQNVWDGIKRNDIDGKFKTLNQPMYDWYYDDYGGYASFAWIELDNWRNEVTWSFTFGSTVKAGVSATIITGTGVTAEKSTTRSATINYKDKDEVLGQVVVNCRSLFPKMNVLSNIEFEVGNTGGSAPVSNFTLPIAAACDTSIALDGAYSQNENRFFVEIYPTSSVGSSDVIGQYFSQWSIDDRPVSPIDLASVYQFKSLSGPSTVYRVKLAVANLAVPGGGWNEKVKYVTVNSTAVPAFSLPSPVANGQPVILDGSASTGETKYFLEMYRTSGYGTSGVTGAYASQWFNGQAGQVPLHSFYASYGGSMTPGWYRVKLAVQNNCTNWVEQVGWVQVVP